MPSMDSILDRLRDAKYLSKVDLRQAYQQIPRATNSRKYTAFLFPGSGLWQYTRISFSLMNAPMTFQQLIDRLFGDELRPFVFGYLDDIVIITNTFEKHLEYLELVLIKLRNAGLEIKREKCEFCVPKISYLGFILDCDGLRLDPFKVAPILDYPVPRDVKQLRRFLGMVR